MSERPFHPGPPRAGVAAIDRVGCCVLLVALLTLISGLEALLGQNIERIWALPSGKGSSSLQMGAHGRAELHKSGSIWTKAGGGSGAGA